MDLDEKVMKDIINNEITFWLDAEKNRLYAEVPRRNGAYSLEPYDSDYFLSFLGHRYREKTGSNVLPNFSELLEIKRQDVIYEEQNRITIHHRIAGSLRRNIVYFLANDLRQSVVIKPTGWKVVRRTKTKFLKTAADLPQMKPVGGGNCLKLLRPYINLQPDDFKLLVVCLIQMFSRKSSHYATVISSAKGTGKSTLTKLIRDLVDPSLSEVTLTPNNDSELKNLLANSFVACFDNTTVLKDSYSSILCAAITGTKEAKRKLYTDCDQIILNLHNIVILNGIDIIPYKSDLTERSLLFELEKISKQRRMTDSSFWSNFKRDKPAILGAIFDTLQRAMQILPTLKVSELERMADAHKEMIAIAQALDISQEEFQRIFKSNQEKLQNAYAQNNPFIELVVSYVNSQKRVDAPAAEVYATIRQLVGTRARFFPESPSAFSRKLKAERDTLEDLGIRFSTHKKSTANYILLEKIPQSQQTKAQKEAQIKFSDASSND